MFVWILRYKLITIIYLRRFYDNTQKPALTSIEPSACCGRCCQRSDPLVHCGRSNDAPARLLIIYDIFYPHLAGDLDPIDACVLVFCACGVHSKGVYNRIKMGPWLIWRLWWRENECVFVYSTGLSNPLHVRKKAVRRRHRMRKYARQYLHIDCC